MATAVKRLQQLVGVLDHPKDETGIKPGVSGSVKAGELPRFRDLPKFKELSGCAWGVWGSNDELGTVNLLTEAVVRQSAADEIKLGKTVSLNWPINFPTKPLFGRKSPEIRMIAHKDGPVRDDEIHINTQSGTQWDGLRHFGILEHGVFYNNTSADQLPSGVQPLDDPNNIPLPLKKIGIQNWANHGICGRGVLLDMVSYFTAVYGKLPYDPWETHAIPLSDILACSKKQGVVFRPADILILRVGFIQRYNSASKAERDALGDKPETFAGLEQSEEMKEFLWDNHFAAVASDQPALERWPTPQGTPHLHQTIIGLWGMPIGELFDLESLAEMCMDTGRYTFFFSSWPLNIIGGCASPPNAAAYF